MSPPPRDAVIEILYADAADWRARRVVSPSRARPTGKYASWKMRRMIRWESQNELNAYRLLDANPAVEAYQEQPLGICYVLNGEAHTHYPDALIDWTDHRELLDIKRRTEATKPGIVARTQLLEAALPARGYSYRMLTAEELEKQLRLFNGCGKSKRASRKTRASR
jgi:hypothetical protein